MNYSYIKNENDTYMCDSSSKFDTNDLTTLSVISDRGKEEDLDDDDKNLIFKSVMEKL